MRGGPGRVLPSVIVGGLLVGGLALGVGTASAAAGSCTYLGQEYPLASHPGLTQNGTNCASTDTSKSVGDILGLSGNTAPGTNLGDTNAPVTSAPDPTPVATNPLPVQNPLPVPKPVPKREHRGSPNKTQTGGGTTVQGGSAAALPAAALPAAALPAAAVAAPPAAVAGLPLAPGLPGLGLPAGFAPTALAGGSLPGGLSSSLFGANFGNPALLAGTPLGAAAASLYQPQADSAVTTVSHSEALATGAPRGIGTPTAIAAIALACVVGILVRSRVLRRIARRDVVTDVLVDEDAPIESESTESAATDLVAAGVGADHEPVMVRRPVLAA